MQENGVQRGKILRKCRKWRSMQRKGKQKHEKKQESRKYYCIKNMGKNRPSPCRKTTNRRTPPREIESVELEKSCAGFRSKLSQVGIYWEIPRMNWHALTDDQPVTWHSRSSWLARDVGEVESFVTHYLPEPHESVAFGCQTSSLLF